MITFRQYLLDVLGTIKPFRKNISHLMVKTQDDGQAVAMATAIDGSMVIDLRSTVPISDFEGSGCFGALDYLHSLLTSPHSEKRNFNMELSTAMVNTRGSEREMIKSIKFSCGKRFNAFYQATNIAAVTGRNARGAGIGARLTNIECAYSFPVDEDMVDEFSNTCRIYGAMPKLKTSSDKIFSMSVNPDVASVQFGAGANQLDVNLSDEITCNTDVTDNIEINLPIQETKSVLGQLGNDSKCDASPEYIKITTEYETMEVSFILSAMKKSANSM